MTMMRWWKTEKVWNVCENPLSLKCDYEAHVKIFFLAVYALAGERNEKEAKKFFAWYFKRNSMKGLKYFILQ